MCEADYKLVAKAIRHRVTAIKRQREKQRRLLDEEPDPVPQPPEPPNQKPSAATSTSAAEMVANQVSLNCFHGNRDTQRLLLVELTPVVRNVFSL